MERSLERVFNPRSVAVIGASEVPGKAAERRTRSLIQGGYQGDILLINPKRSELFGRKAYPNITAVGKEVDLVMIVVAPRFLVTAVADSVKMGAEGILIITAGLGESGEEGKKIETQILQEAGKTGTYVIGPNCSGMFSASAQVNLLGVPPLKEGSISVLAQSGNVIDSLTRYAGVRGAGFSKIISLGNVDELFDMAHAFSTCPIPKGNRVAILSEGGGDNSIAADNAEIYGMEVPVLSVETQERMKPFLLEGMPASNPIDYGGTAEENPHMITECGRVCMDDDQVDGIYITGFFR